MISTVRPSSPSEFGVGFEPSKRPKRRFSKVAVDQQRPRIDRRKTQVVEDHVDNEYETIKANQQTFVKMFETNEIPEQYLQGLYTYVRLKQYLLSPPKHSSKEQLSGARTALGVFQLSELPSDFPDVRAVMQGVCEPRIAMARIARMVNFGAMKLKPNANQPEYIEFSSPTFVQANNKSQSEQRPLKIPIVDLKTRLGIHHDDDAFSLDKAIDLLKQNHFVSDAFEYTAQNKLETLIEKKHAPIVAASAAQILSDPEIYRERFEDPHEDPGGDQVLRLVEIVLSNTKPESRKQTLPFLKQTIRAGLEGLAALTPRIIINSLGRLNHYLEDVVDPQRLVNVLEQADLRDVLSRIQQTIVDLEKRTNHTLDSHILKQYVLLLKHASKYCHSLADVTRIISPVVELKINSLPKDGSFGDSDPIDDVCKAISDEFEERKRVIEERIEAKINTIPLPEIEALPKAEELLAEEFSLIRFELDTCEKLFLDEELQPVKVELQQLRKALNRLDRPFPPNPKAFPSLLKEFAVIIEKIERALIKAHIPRDSRDNLYEAVDGVRHFFHTRTKLMNKCFKSNNPEDEFIKWKQKEEDLLMKSAEVSDLVRVSPDPEKIKAEKLKTEELKRKLEAIFQLMLNPHTDDVTLKEAILGYFKLCSEERNVADSSEVLKRLDSYGIRKLQDLEDAISLVQYHYGWGHRASVYHSRLLRSIAELRNFQRTQGVDKAAKMFGLLGITIILSGVSHSFDVGFQSHDPKLLEFASQKFTSFTFANAHIQSQLDFIVNLCEDIIGSGQLGNPEKWELIGELTKDMDPSQLNINPQAFVDTLMKNAEQIRAELDRIPPTKFASLREFVNPNKPQVVLSPEDPLGTFIRQHGKDAIPSEEVLTQQVAVVYEHIDNLENLRLVRDNKYDVYLENHPITDNSSEVYQFVREIYEQIDLLKLKGCDQTRITSLKEGLSYFESRYVNQQALLRTLDAYNKLMIKLKTPEKAGIKGLAEAFVGSQNTLRKKFDPTSSAYITYRDIYRINRDFFLQQLHQSETFHEAERLMLERVDTVLRDNMNKEVLFSPEVQYAATLALSETKNLQEAQGVFDWYKMLYEKFDHKLEKVIAYCRGGKNIPPGPQHQRVDGKFRRVASDNQQVTTKKLLITEELRETLLSALMNKDGGFVLEKVWPETQKALFALLAHISLMDGVVSPTGAWIHEQAQLHGHKSNPKTFRHPEVVRLEWLIVGIKGAHHQLTFEEFRPGTTTESVAMFTSLPLMRQLSNGDEDHLRPAVFVNLFQMYLQDVYDQEHPKGIFSKIGNAGKGVGKVISKGISGVGKIFR